MPQSLFETSTRSRCSFGVPFVFGSINFRVLLRAVRVDSLMFRVFCWPIVFDRVASEQVVGESVAVENAFIEARL